MAGAALVMLASASCEKKETVKEAQSSVEKADMVFTATASNKSALKTTVKEDGVTAVWSASDKLIVFTAEDTQGSECKLTKGAGETTAEFAGQCAKKGPWTAICPPHAYGYADYDPNVKYDNGVVSFYIKGVQYQGYEEASGGKSTFSPGMMPCVAYSDNDTFEFDHSFGVLKLPVKKVCDSNVPLYQIAITDKTPGSKLWGTFTVNPSVSPVAVKSGSDGSNTITLTVRESPVNDGDVFEYWIVVPEGAFKNGFDVDIDTWETPDHPTFFPRMHYSTTKDNTIHAGEITTMPVIDYSANYYNVIDGEVGARLWEDGPIWGCYNVGESDIPYGYGGYYKWGETEGSSEPISDGTNKYIEDGIPTKYVYNKSTETTDYDYLQPEDDAATANWGSNWKTPTAAEYQELFDNCNHQWVTNYKGSGINGMLFTGKVSPYSNCEVFFPAAGESDNTGVNTMCCYLLQEFTPKAGPGAIVNLGTSIMMQNNEAMPMRVVPANRTVCMSVRAISYAE